MQTSNPLHRPAVRVALSVALILSVPFVAMQFTDEVVWTVGDFVVVGVLLAIIGIALELALKGAGSLATAIGIAALGGLSALWGVAGDAGPRSPEAPARRERVCARSEGRAAQPPSLTLALWEIHVERWRRMH